MAKRLTGLWRGGFQLSIGSALFFAATACNGNTITASHNGRQTFDPPFDVPGINTAGNARAPQQACSPTPPAIVKLDVNTRYKAGGAHDVVSAEAEARYKEAMAPIIAYMVDVTLSANRYIKSNGRNIGAADCARSALATWAQANALSQVDGTAGRFKQSTLLAGLALTFLQIRNAPTAASGQADNHKIEGWLLGLAQDLRRYRDSAPLGGPARNNQLYWAGLAIGATGAATGDADSFDFGMNALEDGVKSITADGYLPEELKRGQQALHYHVYSLQPLMLLAELAQRNGRPAYDQNDRALHRLVRTVLAGAKDPSLFGNKVGTVQVPVINDKKPGLPPALWGWLAVYSARFGVPDGWQDLLANSPRLSSAETGGDEITLYMPRKVHYQR